MQKEAKPRQNSNQSQNNLTTRLQQIVELLYKDNDQFSKGLPSQQQFQQMLMHSYNCYDQLDFIILDYSKHSVYYLDPKTIAEHMHRIMRVTKYLFSNIRHWVESYSLDIVKKVSEERTYFPSEATHQPRCTSCKRYVEQMVLKEAREEILGCYDVRELFEQELRQAKEEEKLQKPLTAKETTEYVGSVNFLTRVIKEMEESAHEYSKLTEHIEKEDTNEEIALRYLEDLLSAMRKRIGEKCIYRLKRVVKNWEKTQSQQHQNISKKPLFNIKQIINENYIPNGSNDKKNQMASFSNGMLKRLKEENHQLQVQYNTLNCTYNAAKNSLAFLERHDETQRKEIERLNDLISQNNLERNSIVKQRQDSRRNTTKNQAELTIHSPKLTAGFNNYAKEKKLAASHKAGKYSKFKVKKMSRQSEILSNSTNKTIDLTYGQFSAQNKETEQNEPSDRETEQNEPSDQSQNGTVDVGVQWQEQLAGERVSKIKQKKSRNSKAHKISNRQRMPIAKVSKIQQQTQMNLLQQCNYNSSKDKKNSRITLDNSIKSRPNLKKENRLSLEETKVLRKQSTTIRKLLENQQQKASLAQLGEIKELGTNQKVSVKLLQGQPSTNKINLQKINIYDSISKHRQLKHFPFQNKGFIIKDLPEAKIQNHFSQQIKKILNMRMATEGNQVKKKTLKVRNAIFKPQHLELFGGVSESYAYEHSKDILGNLQQTAKGYFSELKSYLINLRSFKNHLYDNIVLFMKSPFTLIDKDEMETKLVGDKQLTAYIKKLIGFHQRKCQKIPCQHLQQFDSIIGLAHFQ